MSYTARQRLGMRILLVFTLAGAIAGMLLGRAIERRAAANSDVAPEAATDSYYTFQPTDTAPYCLPEGTVAYEVCDSATRMRYWVLRWPEGKGYAIVPRMVFTDGQLQPYWPDYKGGGEGD